MDFEAILQNLETRITQGKAWLESGKDLNLGGPSLRKRPTNVQVVEFLDSPGRIERFGLGFLVTLQTQPSPRKFQVNVRIKSTFTEGPKADSNPYVVLYVVDQIRDAEELIWFEHFKSPSLYEKFEKFSTREWYLHWLSVAFDKGSGKVLTEAVRIS